MRNEVVRRGICEGEEQGRGPVPCGGKILPPVRNSQISPMKATRLRAAEGGHVGPRQDHVSASQDDTRAELESLDVLAAGFGMLPSEKGEAQNWTDGSRAGIMRAEGQ